MDESGRASALPQRHRARLSRYVALMHAFILVSFVVVIVALALPPLGRDHVVAHLVLAAGMAVLAALTVVRGERAEHLVLALPLAGFAGLPLLSHAEDVSGPLAFTACTLLAVRTLGVGGFVATAVGALSLMTVVRLVLGVELTYGNGGSYLLGIAYPAIAGAFVRSLERSTEAMDDAEARNRTEQLRLMARRAQERAVEGARRVLHDDVLAALRAIVDDHGADAVRRQAHEAVEAVDRLERDDAGPDAIPAGAGGADPLERWVSRLREASPIPFTTTIDLSDAPRGLTRAVPDAAYRAALEALRNAHRHAGVPQATLTVTGHADGVEFTVRDDGPGIPDGAVEGFGMRESIRGAVAAAGGRVEITSSPEGTTVRCGFDAPASRPGDDLERTYWRTLSAGGRRRLFTDTMVPLGAAWVVIAGEQVVRSGQVLSQGALMLAAVAILAAVTLRLRQGPPSLPWLAGITAVMLTGQVVALTLLPAGGLLSLQAWSVGFFSASLLVLCFVLPTRWALALIGVHVALILAAWVVDPALTEGRLPVASLNAVTAIPALTALLGAGLRRNAGVVEAAQARAFAASSEVLRRRLLGEVSSLHLDHTRHVVVPWLREVAAGRLDPAAPAVRERARLLMLEARDDLHAPGFHDPELRAAVSAYRGRGGVVDIRPGFEPGAHERRSGQLLRSLVERLPGGHRVTLSPPSPGSTSARLVVVPPPEPAVTAMLEAEPAARVQQDDVAVAAELDDTVVTGRGGQPSARESVRGA